MLAALFGVRLPVLPVTRAQCCGLGRLAGGGGGRHANWQHQCFPLGVVAPASRRLNPLGFLVVRAHRQRA